MSTPTRWTHRPALTELKPGDLLPAADMAAPEGSRDRTISGSVVQQAALGIFAFPAGTGFDTWTTPGTYHSQFTAALTNEPLAGGTNGRWLTLEVQAITHAGGTHVAQVLRYDLGWSAGRMFWRVRDATTWSAWREVWTSVSRGVAVADLAQAISNPPSQVEVQAIQARLNALLASLRGAGLLSP